MIIYPQVAGTTPSGVKPSDFDTAFLRAAGCENPLRQERLDYFAMTPHAVATDEFACILGKLLRTCELGNGYVDKDDLITLRDWYKDSFLMYYIDNPVAMGYETTQALVLTLRGEPLLYMKSARLHQDSLTVSLGSPVILNPRSVVDMMYFLAQSRLERKRSALEKKLSQQQADFNLENAFQCDGNLVFHAPTVFSLENPLSAPMFAYEVATRPCMAIVGSLAGGGVKVVKYVPEEGQTGPRAICRFETETGDVVMCSPRNIIFSVDGDFPEELVQALSEKMEAPTSWRVIGRSECCYEKDEDVGPIFEQHIQGELLSIELGAAADYTDTFEDNWREIQYLSGLGLVEKVEGLMDKWELSELYVRKCLSVAQAYGLGDGMPVMAV